MHGIFSIFKKKPAPQAVVVKSSSKEESPPSRHESFCNVDELMHTEPEVKPIYISEEPKSRHSTYTSEPPKSRKKYAAPAAPEPPKEETFDFVTPEEPKDILNLDIKNNKTEPLPYDEGLRSPSPEPNRVSETVQEALETKMEVENRPEGKRPESELPGVYGVIHYTPQSTIRSSTRSLARIGAETDVPYVERKSNINLSGMLKTIPVSQFDGTIGRQQKKEAAPAPPPPALPSSPPPSLYEQHRFNDSAVIPNTNTISTVSSEQMWADSRSARDAAAEERNSPTPYRTNSNGSSGTTREVEVASDMNLSFSERMDNNEMMREMSTSDDTTYDDDMIEAAEITREFETLKAKFERWRALQAANRNSAEARQLHMEIMHQNDTLMKKLQQTTDMAGHTGRNRPIISPETFLPWNERSRTPRLPSSPRTAPASDVHRRPALPNRWTPAPSMHSLSPATSTSSEETDRSQQYYDGRRSQAVATDRYSSPGTNRPAQNVPQSSDDDEKARAILRVEQEANELKRKEQELRSTIGYSTAKEAGLMASTSRLQNDQHRGSSYTPSTLPKNYHSRISSDGNNNAYGAQRSPVNLYQGKQPAPIPQAARQFQPSSVPKNVNSNYTRGNWNGTLHSSLTSLIVNNDEAMRIESSPTPSLKHSPQPNRMSPLPEGEVTQPVNPNAVLNAPINNRAPSAPDLCGNNNISKFSPSLVKKNASPFEEKRENKHMPPLTPNAGSNIRKVKEAVKQQSLSQKTAANLLLQKQTTSHTPLNQVTKGFDKDRVNVNDNKPKQSPTLGRNNNGPASNARTVSDEEVSKNIAKILKEGMSTLKKTAPPVEKSGIALGRVVEPNRVDDSARTRYDGGAGQQTRPYASASIPTQSTKPAPAEPTYAPPPPAPAHPPPAPAPPAPPPPPPPNLIASSTQRISSQPPSSQRQPRGVENQRTSSAPAKNGPRAAVPDVRDNLMAEIRNAGGIRALRKVPRQH